MIKWNKHKARLGTPNIHGLEQTKAYYDKKYLSPYPVDNLMPVYLKGLSFLKTIGKENTRVLDIGCGTGEMARLIHQAGFTNYLGIDISSSGIERAKVNVPAWYKKFMIFDCYKIKKLNYAYDVAITLEVLEHIQDMELLSQLRRGIHLIASVPNYWSSHHEHIRTYPHRLHTWWRYRKYMKFLKWHKYRLNKYRFIMIFLAIIK